MRSHRIPWGRLIAPGDHFLESGESQFVDGAPDGADAEHDRQVRVEVKRAALHAPPVGPMPPRYRPMPSFGIRFRARVLI